MDHDNGEGKGKVRPDLRQEDSLGACETWMRESRKSQR